MSRNLSVIFGAVFLAEIVLGVWAVGRIAGQWRSPLLAETTQLASPR